MEIPGPTGHILYILQFSGVFAAVSCIQRQYFPARLMSRHPGHTDREVTAMEQKKSPSRTMDLRLDPEARLCPAFDSVSIKKFAAPDPEEMGVRVLDNCAEEHMM